VYVDPATLLTLPRDGLIALIEAQALAKRRLRLVLCKPGISGSNAIALPTPSTGLDRMVQALQGYTKSQQVVSALAA